MNRKNLAMLPAAALLITVSLFEAGCENNKASAAAEAPPPSKVVSEANSGVVQVDRPEQFELYTAEAHQAASELNATGVVSPDISRTVPVISVATGRVVDIRARLGDTVTKGQLLLRVQSADIASAYSDYRKAVADEKLASTQYERAKRLYDHGAISLNEFQTSEDVENKAKVDVENTTQRLRVLGSSNLDRPSGIVDIRAPVSGVITDQQVTNASGVQGLTAPTNPFTISDLSHVWIVCDVYENNLPQIHLGDFAEVRLNAYPDQVLRGRIANISPVLDPNIRTAKVRLELPNPGFLRVGMFVTATFHGRKAEQRASVPASAILHLHDRNWVYVPAGDKQFRRVEVTVGNTLPDDMQEVIAGLTPGTPVVRKALVLENTVEQ